MYQEDDNKHFGVRAVEEFADGLARDHSIINESNKGSASRLVWFVAISGFGFLNIRSYATSVGSGELGICQQILLSIPWSLTAIFGIISHWLLGELMARDNNYYILKQHAIRSFMAKANREPSMDEVLTIINVDDTDPDVRQMKHLVDRLYPWVTWAERITFILLLFSFIWSVVYPMIIL